jgi:hypothetical protein
MGVLCLISGVFIRISEHRPSVAFVSLVSAVFIKSDCNLQFEHSGITAV